MPMIRAMRLLNAIEAGTTTGAQLQTLLAADPGRLAEWNVLLGMRGQTRRMAASSTAMTAVAASSTAMTAVAASSTAMAAVAASSTAMTAVNANDQAVRIWMLAGTNQVYSNFASVAAVAASSTAMTAVAASSTAMTAVAASSTAMAAVAASSTAMAAVAASSTAMTAVIASSTAMAAVTASNTAMNAVVKSATASEAICGALQPYRTAVVNTLNAAPTTVFTKAANVVVGNGSGTFDVSGLQSIYIPISCTDDNDTDYQVQHLSAPNPVVASIPRHPGTVAVTAGLTLRGVRVFGAGGSGGSVTFDVYTAV